MKAAFSVAALAACCALPVFAQDPAAHRQQIEGVVEAYRKAIAAKDSAAFMGLFLREDITWTGVYTDASVARQMARRSDPQAPLPHKVSNDSPRKFIDSIVKSKEAKSETFSNVRIDTDGDIAHVWFDYVFMTGGYRNNWGKESWQLVRTEQGWKIAAVTWSSEANPVPR